MAAEQGGRAKVLRDSSDGPWTRWRTKEPAKRAIRFIETYCKLPKGHGAGEKMRLAEFQKDWIRAILAGDVRSACMSVGRGNGKSTLLAALALWAVFDSNRSGAPQVPVVATTVSQAIRAVYGVAVDMIEAEDELARRCKVYTAIGATKVEVPSTGGELFPVSDDPEGLQGLDPSLAVCDEIGFQSVEAWDALLLASGKRPLSLVIGIGTPGTGRNNALWHLRERVQTHRLPGFHYTEYSADPECATDDREAWHAANPALAEGYMSEDALEMAHALAPEGHFRIFRLGQWTEGVDSWLGASGARVWSALEEERELVEGAPTWVGLDVGLKRDSTGLVALQETPAGWYAAAWIWTPAADEPIDVTDVMARLRDLDRRFDLQEVSYDPRFFDVPAKTLGDEGLPMVEIPQSVDRMTNACGRTYELIMGGTLAHHPDPLFASHVLAAVPRYHQHGFTLTKAKSRGQIDACIALCLAVDRAHHPPKKRAPLVAF